MRFAVRASQATPSPDAAQPRPEQVPQADLRWLGQFIARHRGAAVAAVVSGMVGGAATGLQPYFIGRIIDDIRQGVSLEQLLVDVIMLIGLALVVIIAFFGQRTFSGHVAYSVNYDIRRALFENLLSLDQGFYQRYSTGDLISRMHSDVEMVWRLLAITFNRIGSAVLTLIVTFLLLGAINLPLTIAVLVILTLSTAFQFRAGRALSPLFERVQDQAGMLAALVQDTVSGIQTVKTFGREAGVAAKYHQENLEYRRRWLFFRRRNEPVGMLPKMISEATAGLVVLFGGVLALTGTMTLGNFAQFLLNLGAISEMLLQLGTIYQRFQQTRGALARLTPLLQAPAIADAPDAVPLPEPRGEIRFEGVGLDVWGKPLLRNVSLTIPAGRTVAVVGPTGCGKTLLVNLLARVMDVSEGRILVDGIDVRRIQLADLRRAIAYVPQSTFLFSQPLHRNVRMTHLSLDDDALWRAIEIARLSKDLPQLPDGLDTLVGERGVMLSGGQKQRVAIARAIAHDPAILVLDDALSSVDMHTAADILAGLRGVVRSRTSLIIAHRIATVKDADYVYVMDEGQIVAQGTHDELLAQGGMYAHMVEREGLAETEPDHGEDAAHRSAAR
jgi:ATP-binding cassette subfamily B protein